MPEATDSKHPALSILVIGYRMPEQLSNTLVSLGAAYQQGVTESQYEVVVVENESDAMLDATFTKNLPDNFSYLRRADNSVSPVAAMAEGLALCRGEWLGVIIDGAQMVTPGVVRFALQGFRYAPDPLIAVPGYHLGTKLQHELADPQAFLEKQRRYLSRIDWQRNGYRLFEWACFSPANRHGFLHPLMESNVFFCSRQSFIEIDGADQRFQLPGGGAINLHLLRKLGLDPRRPLILLAGEGTFHQYHGGVTTSDRSDHDQRVADFRAQLQQIWQNNFKALRREPVLLGQFPEHSLKFLERSAAAANRRVQRLTEGGIPLWEDDMALGLPT